MVQRIRQGVMIFMKAKSSLVGTLSGSLRAHPLQAKVTAQRRGRSGFSIGRSTTPTNPNTQPQQDQRNKFKLCRELWHVLDEDQQAKYEAAAKLNSITAYNQFMSLCLNDGSELLFETQHTDFNHTLIIGAFATYGQLIKPGSHGADEENFITRYVTKMYRVGLPGTMIVKLGEDIAEGDPWTNTLETIEIDANEITTDTDGEDVDFYFSHWKLKPGYWYSIHFLIIGGSFLKCIKWKTKGDAGAPPGYRAWVRSGVSPTFLRMDNECVNFDQYGIQVP